MEVSAGRITEKVTKHQRIAYSVAQVFAEVKVQKKRILIRFFGTSWPDPRGLVTNIPATHRWQHDKEIAVDTPAQRLGVLLRSLTQPCQPSLIWQSGRPAHCPFRGLLGVHSRYGLHTRAVTVFRDTLSEGFSHFVASMTAPVASGWSVRRVGFAPTGKRRLITAHGRRGHWFSAVPG